MKKFALILGILIFVDIVYFAFINVGQAISYNYEPFFGPFSIDKGMAVLFLTLYTALGTYLITYYTIANLKQKLKKQTRNVEKASVETEENSDKIKALESKINTLEKALQEALKR